MCLLTHLTPKESLYPNSVSLEDNDCRNSIPPHQSFLEGIDGNSRTKLLENELFGHYKGAFTGATDDQIGAFQRADGGTLYLDEIGEMPKELQAKLLRAIEAKEITPLGGESLPVDVRILAATSVPLKEAVTCGAFRVDLFYRISVVDINLPSLRERKEDIPALIDHFLSLYTYTK